MQLGLLFRASVTAYAMESSFFLLQISLEGARSSGVGSWMPCMLPFRPCIVAEAALASACTLAVLYDPLWWTVFDVAAHAHVVAFLSAETAIELALLYATAMACVPGALTYGMSSILALASLTLIRTRHSSAEERFALSTSAFCAARLISESGVDAMWSFLLIGVGAELAIQHYMRRYHGPTLRQPKSNSLLSRTGYALLLYVVGIRACDSEAWDLHRPLTNSVVPDELRGCVWHCNGTVLASRRIHASQWVDEGMILMPLAYWREIAFYPGAPGALMCLVAGLRLPITVRARVRRDSGTIYLDQSDVLFLGVVLPKHLTSRLQSMLRPQSRCSAYPVVFAPSPLTLRRATELVLTLIRLRMV